MVDCDLCTRAVVTAVPVRVPSRWRAYRETGRWAGLCESCFERLRGAAAERGNGRRCALCRERRETLLSVALALPGGGEAARAICDGCLAACRSASAPEPAATGH